jgi:hypothetical protein
VISALASALGVDASQITIPKVECGSTVLTVLISAPTGTGSGGSGSDALSAANAIATKLSTLLSSNALVVPQLGAPSSFSTPQVIQAAAPSANRRLRINFASVLKGLMRSSGVCSTLAPPQSDGIEISFANIFC